MSDAAAVTPSAPQDAEHPTGEGGEKQILGVSNGKMAMWIFLGSDGMSFMGLIASYVALRVASMDTWPSPAQYLGIGLASAITFLLICSSVTMVKAYEGAVEKDVKKLKFYLGLTILGGVLFLCGQVYEYTHFLTNTHETSVRVVQNGEVVETTETTRLKVSGIYDVSHDEEGNVVETLRPETKNFGATFYVLTSFHGCHVLSGVIYLLCVLVGVMRGRWNANNIEIVGLYWHFVDLVWIVIFTIVYLVETSPPV